MRSYSLFGILFIVVCSSFLALAQTADTAGVEKKSLLKLSIKDLMDVKVVTASRKEQAFSEAPANVIVVTSQMIRDRGYNTLNEVFEDLPGFDFTMKQPSGEYPSHSIFRGITDVGQTKLLFMVDGIVQNDISNGWLNNVGYDFPLNDIDRIELISGPGSSLYGANAYAGLINVITRDPLEGNDQTYFLEAKLSYGSNTTISPEIFAGYKFDNGLTMQLAARLYTSKGDGGLDRYDPGNYFHNNYEPDSVLTTEYGNIVNNLSVSNRKRIPDGFKNEINDYAIRGKIRKDNFSLGFSYWNKQEGLGSEVVGYEYFTYSDNLDYTVRHSGLTLYSTYDMKFSSSFTTKTLFYYRNTKVLPETGFYYTYKYQSVNNGIDPPVSNKKKGYSGEGFEIRLEQQFNYDFSKNHNLVFGFLLEQKNGQYYGISLGPEQDEYSTVVQSTYISEERTVQPFRFEKNAAAYVQDQYNFSDKYSLTTGLRYDYNIQYKSVLNPRIAFIASPFEDISVKFLYGHAYKAPTLFELYDEWRGNDQLEPQKIETTEIELYYYLLSNLGVKLNYFYSQLDNLITEAPNPDPQKIPIGPNGEHETYYQNIGNTKISGFTFSIDQIISENLKYSANYTYLIGENGTEINNVAKHKINFSLDYNLMNKININLRANYIGKVKAPETNLYFYPKTQATISQIGYDYLTAEKNNGYVEDVLLLNLTLRGTNLFDFADIEPQLIVRNLLDTDYYTVGRQAGSGLRPVNEIQPVIQNPSGFIPAYHPQPGRDILFRLVFKL